MTHSIQEMLRTYNRDHQHPLNRASHVIGIPMIVLSPLGFVWGWRQALGLFVVGWLFQFAGHAIEGKMPTFFSNPAYLLIGPIHFGRKALAKLTASSSAQPRRP